MPILGPLLRAVHYRFPMLGSSSAITATWRIGSWDSVAQTGEGYPCKERKKSNPACGGANLGRSGMVYVSQEAQTTEVSDFVYYFYLCCAESSKKLWCALRLCVFSMRGPV